MRDLISRLSIYPDFAPPFKIIKALQVAKAKSSKFLVSREKTAVPDIVRTEFHFLHVSLIYDVINVGGITYNGVKKYIKIVSKVIIVT